MVRIHLLKIMDAARCQAFPKEYMYILVFMPILHDCVVINQPIINKPPIYSRTMKHKYVESQVCLELFTFLGRYRLYNI